MPEGDVCGVGGGGGRRRRVTEGVGVSSTSDWPWQVGTVGTILQFLGFKYLLWLARWS